LFMPPDVYMYETDQRAVIFYENNVETLILSTTFRGSAKDFGWVVPVPSKPEVSRGSDEIFTSLDELTRVENNYFPNPLGGLGINDSVQKEAPVLVVETKKIDYYDITVLTASDSQALAEWLEKNRYQFPQNSSYILDSYISNQWYFVAIKIDASSASFKISSQLREGHMVPLKLEFSTDRIVFPLKISSLMENKYQPSVIPLEESLVPDIASEQGMSTPPSDIYSPSRPYYPSQVGILIYVFTPENKQILPGFETSYAGWVKKDEIKDLAFDEKGNPLINPTKDKYFLTKLTRWMSYSQMTDDLYLRNAPDNDLVDSLPLKEKNPVWFWIAMGLSVAMILGVGAALVYLSKK
ncbi:MAG: DUF2330 domain-containing protein, partial [Candidatus Portnoybacteria bacterium]|nr:DUF2330 domain-containing protein [Candidatus Portnoybacteria bacterium]